MTKTKLTYEDIQAAMKDLDSEENYFLPCLCRTDGESFFCPRHNKLQLGKSQAGILHELFNEELKNNKKNINKKEYFHGVLIIKN